MNDALFVTRNAHNNGASHTWRQCQCAMTPALETLDHVLGEAGLVHDLIGMELMVGPCGIDGLFEVLLEEQVSNCSVRHGGDDLRATGSAHYESNAGIVSED